MRRNFTVLLALALGGCSVDAESLRGPGILDAGAGVAIDAGTPDTLIFPDAVPGMDSVAAEAPRAASDSLSPDAVPAVDVRPPAVDTAPDSRKGDTLPAPDLAPECPFAAWVPPPASSPADTRPTCTVQAPETAFCFTLCGTLVSLYVGALPARTVTINGVPALAVPNDVSGSLPGTLQPLPGSTYVVRVSAGATGSLTFTGWTSGTCQGA